MTDEVRADFRELAHLAGEILTAADQLDDGVRGPGPDWLPMPGAFGDTEAGGDLSEGYQRTVEALHAVTDRFAGVLEDDVDRVSKVAFAYQKVDTGIAESINQGISSNTGWAAR